MKAPGPEFPVDPATPQLRDRMLVRTNQGWMIHHSMCHTVHRPGAKAAPWKWANTVGINQVQFMINHYRLRVCRICLRRGVH